MKLLVLGAGLVGGPIALDLAADAGNEVTAVDRAPAALARVERAFAQRRGIPACDAASSSRGLLRTIAADLADEATVARLASEADLVVNAAPGCLGYSVLRTVLDVGRSAVDIAFFPEDPFTLDALAKQRGVAAIVDAGVAPGLSHMLSGYAHAQLEQTDSIRIDVGGLPSERAWPYEYKAVFSPRDVIAEYTRPARLVENGQPVVRPALTEPERLDVPGVGTLEAFNSDGLRTLLSTLPVPDMKEKTLRYPGHADKMMLLRDTGFFSEQAICVAGQQLRPIDLTAQLLASSWRLAEGEADLTVMRVVVTGSRGSERVRHTFSLLDRFDQASGIHSMARTTGYTATAVVRLLASGWRPEPGIVAPELLGCDARAMKLILAWLAERGVTVTEQCERLGACNPAVPIVRATETHASPP